MSETQQTQRPANAVDKTTEAQILEVVFAEPIRSAAAPGAAVDIVLVMRDKDGDDQTWRSEYSNSYGTGNNANRTRAQMTVDALASVGWQGGHDLSSLDTALVGKVVPISVRWTYSENRNQWYKNVYLGHGGLRRIEKTSAMDIIRAINGGGEPAPTANGTAMPPPPQASFSTTPANPFAPRA